ncbi:hypothetical protein ACP70R_019404 [Stipagrostis hirtigluma subsp. patula]
MEDDKGKKKKAESPLQGPGKKKARRSDDDASITDAAPASRDAAAAPARQELLVKAGQDLTTMNQGGLAAAGGSVPGIQKQVKPPPAPAAVRPQPSPPRLKKKPPPLQDPKPLVQNQRGGDDLGQILSPGIQQRAAAAAAGLSASASSPLQDPKPLVHRGGDDLGQLLSPGIQQRAVAAASGSSGSASSMYHVGGSTTVPQLQMHGMVMGGLLPAAPRPSAAAPLLRKLDAPLPAAPAAQALAPASHAAGASTELQLGPPGTQTEKCPACGVGKGAMAAHPTPHRCLCENCVAANASCPVCADGSRAGGT